MTEITKTEQKIVLHSITDQRLAEMRSTADDIIQTLKNDLLDTEQAKLVERARLDAKKIRVQVEKKRKKLKEEPLRLCQAIDDEARRLRQLIEPIEDDCARAYAEHTARLEQEAEERRREARLQLRKDTVARALSDAGRAVTEEHRSRITDDVIANWTDTEYIDTLSWIRSREQHFATRFQARVSVLKRYPEIEVEHSRLKYEMTDEDFDAMIDDADKRREAKRREDEEERIREERMLANNAREAEAEAAELARQNERMQKILMRLKMMHEVQIDTRNLTHDQLLVIDDDDFEVMIANAVLELEEQARRAEATDKAIDDLIADEDALQRAEDDLFVTAASVMSHDETIATMIIDALNEYDEVMSLDDDEDTDDDASPTAERVRSVEEMSFDDVAVDKKKFTMSGQDLHLIRHDEEVQSTYVNEDDVTMYLEVKTDLDNGSQAMRSIQFPFSCPNCGHHSREEVRVLFSND